MRIRRTRKESASRVANDAFREVVSRLEIPHPFSIEQLCDNLAAIRGRPIHIHAMERQSATHSSPCGVWIALEDADHIFVEEATSPLHRVHIILHELCHMLLGHSSLPGEDRLSGEEMEREAEEAALALAAAAWPEIPRHTVVSALGRTSYTDENEKAAESLAGLIAEYVHRSETAANGPDDQLVNHLMNALSEG
ncbi:ImmA/IrrE family metallo-endopeptidase [Streptacidiphilus griseoplanus]|uniref:ImmA/IrrE family metallo-endopeptidase n=1 Tax=Peterkaempfera griseoplana TaxID=66896 RepID=UPI0006E1981D|nr:ImmA/IrrE family metallo-endopeptidase [Peterkaempfera griseoplana]